MSICVTWYDRFVLQNVTLDFKCGFHHHFKVGINKSITSIRSVYVIRHQRISCKSKRREIRCTTRQRDVIISIRIDTAYKAGFMCMH